MNRSINQILKTSFRTKVSFPVPNVYLNSVQNDIQAEIQALHDNGTYKYEREIVGKQGK